MLETNKIRLIPTLLYKETGLVKGVGFDSWRWIGSVIESIKVYNLREVDELIFLDITATDEARPLDIESIDDYADDCFMPLAVGGGIRDTEDVRKLLQVGADKVVINTQAVDNPVIIKEIAARFGSQCLVVSIDARRLPNGSYEAYTHSGKNQTGIDPVTIAKRSEDFGAGEIIVTSIDRDGTMSGYDMELIRSISDAVSIPVIAAGGAGKPQDFVDALILGKASAVAAAAIFHFTQTTPLEVKKYMKQCGLNVRI